MDTQMINFSIPTALLRQMDRTAEIESRNRSEFLREAIRQYLQEREERQRDFALIRRSAERINMTEEEAYAYVEKIRNTLPMNRKKSR
ncbi:ribbon-helix-helix protein, CopG family [Candidatus Gottesmanbacteria bacterium]|nr:ribbon-helix-helix protein, CopG family [Candidatus Gottesmanbacteria bacterium]